MPQLGQNVRRLFIDPASISSGFAYYVGKELKSHGTVAVDKKLPVFERLRRLYDLYLSCVVTDSVDECHIELLPRTCHIFTHWSVAVIGLAVQRSSVSGNILILADVPVKSWQKHTSWDTIKLDWKQMGYSSEDNMAAVMIGRYYTETKT